jgi:rubredoxin
VFSGAPDLLSERLLSYLKEVSMDKWECPCGYIYDPAEGDAENNIPIGTAFEELPEDWVCPKCGAEKEFFEKLD